MILNRESYRERWYKTTDKILRQIEALEQRLGSPETAKAIAVHSHLDPGVARAHQALMDAKKAVQSKLDGQPKAGFLKGAFLSKAEDRKAKENTEKLRQLEDELTIRVGASRTRVDEAMTRPNPGPLDIRLIEDHARVTKLVSEELPLFVEISVKVVFVGMKVEDIAVTRDIVVAGAFGEIHVGETADRRKVACKGVKHLTVDDDSPPGRRKKRRLMREKEIWQSLNHTNILPFLGTCRISGVDFLVSEYIENGELIPYLNAHPKLSRVQVLRDVARGLNYLHTHPQAIVHGDVKPDNILIRDDHVYLIDFGLSKTAIDETSCGSMKSYGTSKYLSPERIRGHGRSAADDVWSFGITMASVYRGGDPFCGDFDSEDTNIREAIAKYNKTPPLENSRLHWKLASVCWRQLDKDPKRPSITEVLAALEGLVKNPLSLKLTGIRNL